MVCSNKWKKWRCPWFSENSINGIITYTHTQTQLSEGKKKRRRVKITIHTTPIQWRIQVLKIINVLWRLRERWAYIWFIHHPDLFTSNNPFLSSILAIHTLHLADLVFPPGKFDFKHLTNWPPPTYPSDSLTLLLCSYGSTASLKPPALWLHYFLFFISLLMLKSLLHSLFSLEFISHHYSLTD